MWQGVRQEDGSAHTTYGSEEEGVGGPPAQALGEREQRSPQWIASLVGVLRIIILIVVLVDHVALIERANALLVLSIIFYIKLIKFK